MRLATLLLITAAVGIAQTKPDLITLTDQLQRAMDSGDWKKAAHLSTSLKNAVDEYRNRSLSRDSSQQVDAILSWLPADTETVAVAQQPFTLTEKDPQGVPDALTWARGYVLGLLYAADDGRLRTKLQDRTLRLALLAARKFQHQPEDSKGRGALGMIAFERCAAYTFANVLSESIFAKPAETSVLGQPTWEVKGELSEKEGKDTFFIVLPKPDLMLACNNRDFLSTMLSRMAAPGRVALPQALVEWKHVDQSAPLWALRHFRSERASVDPTDPHNEGVMGDRDPDAIGVTVQVGSPTPSTVSARWISRSDDNHWKSFAEIPDAKNRFATRRISLGIWEVKGSGDAEVSAFAIFALMGVLGFAVLV